MKSHHHQQGHGIKDEKARVIVPCFAGEFLIAVFGNDKDRGNTEAIANDREGKCRKEEERAFPEAHPGGIGPSRRDHEKGHEGANAAAKFIDHQRFPVFVRRKNRGPGRVSAHAADLAELLGESGGDVLEWDRGLLDVGNGNAEPQIKDRESGEDKSFSATEIPDQSRDDERERANADAPLDDAVGDDIKQAAEDKQDETSVFALGIRVANFLPTIREQTCDDEGEKDSVLIASFTVPAAVKQFQ